MAECDIRQNRAVKLSCLCLFVVLEMSKRMESQKNTARMCVLVFLCFSRFYDLWLFHECSESFGDCHRWQRMIHRVAFGDGRVRRWWECILCLCVFSHCMLTLLHVSEIASVWSYGNMHICAHWRCQPGEMMCTDLWQSCIVTPSVYYCTCSAR